MESVTLEDADRLTSVVPFDDGLLVAGWLEERFGAKAAVWRSEDGATWQRFEPDGLGKGHVLDVLETDGGLLGVGGFVGSSNLGDAAIWRSADGIEWQQLPATAFELGSQYGSGARIARGGPGFIVVGSQHTLSEVDVAVWLSTDGEEWESVPRSAAFDSAFPTSLLVREDGLIVVGVSICDETGCTNGAVMASRDGREWQRHRDESGPPESVTPALHALVPAGPTEILGIGTSYEPGPLIEVDDIATGVWHSADGISWEVSVGPEQGRALTAIDGRFFASGRWGGECQQENPSVWTSTDGREWQAAWVSADGGSIDRMAIWQDRLVMIGTVPDFARQAFRKVVWVQAP